MFDDYWDPDGWGLAEPPNPADGDGLAEWETSADSSVASDWQVDDDSVTDPPNTDVNLTDVDLTDGYINTADPVEDLADASWTGAEPESAVLPGAVLAGVAATAGAVAILIAILRRRS